MYVHNNLMIFKLTDNDDINHYDRMRTYFLRKKFSNSALIVSIHV